MSPSGASRGTNEAVPFFDDDPDKTVSQFNRNFAAKIRGLDASDAGGDHLGALGTSTGPRTTPGSAAPSPTR